MTTIGIPPRSQESWDVPADKVAAEAERLSAQYLIGLQIGRAAEQRHLVDPADNAFARMACEHPEACSCPEDYPNWRPGGAA